MKKINLVKKNFYFAIIVVVLLFVAGFVIAEWDSSKPSHGILYTNQIEPKIGTDINLIGNILVNGLPLGMGYWTLLGNNIYYNNGNVGIGTTNPTEKLEVVGNIKASGTICDSNANCLGGVSSVASLPACSDGQFLKYNSVTGGWECSSGAAAGVSFGDWTNQGTLATGGIETLVKDHVYVAQTDGFVTAYGTSYNTIGIQTPDGTTRCTIGLGHGNDKTGNLCPVKKGDTWKLVSNVAGALTIYWIPLGGGGSGGETPNTYDSGWFACTRGGKYVINHNLNSDKIIFQVFFSTSADGSNAVTQYAFHDHSHGDFSHSVGAMVKPTSANSCTIQAGASYAGYVFGDTGAGAKTVSGYYRLLAIKST